MTRETIFELLERVQSGATTPTAALRELAKLPFEDAGFARIDHHRALRLGLPEVIYAAGKTPAQVAEIFARMASTGGSVLATRASAQAFDAVQARVPEAHFHEEARVIGLRKPQPPADGGAVAVICAGTSDLPIAEEAAVTAEYLGLNVARIADVGVAGLHRILAERETLRNVRAAIVCAGMEGALP
ncbi:MAG: 1-(5-phosphoribosyl)-5-amino-4-imidazole-carboxylate carboxylase, partial [Acidobacteriaceae bacterium]